MLDGPYEPAIGALAWLVADCEPPPVAWHILTASIWQLPAGAAIMPICGPPPLPGVSVLLEQPAGEIAIVANITSAEMPVSFRILVVGISLPVFRLGSILM